MAATKSTKSTKSTKMSRAERRVFECAYAVAFVAFFREATAKRFSRPGAYAAMKAAELAIEAAFQLRDNNLG